MDANQPTRKPDQRADLKLIYLSGQAPFSQEAEEAVIGAVLVNPSAFIDVSPFLSPEDFYILRHSYIWEALIRLDARGVAIDYLTVQEELRALNRLTEIGGPAYLTQMVNNTPTSMHAAAYADFVHRTAIRRRLMQAADEIKALAVDEEMALEKTEPESQARLNRAWAGFHKNGDQTWADTVGDVMGEVEERMQSPGETGNEVRGGIPFLSDLDAITGGWRRGLFYIVGGRPSMGKTSLLLSAANRALMLGARIGMFSQEMSRKELVYRMASIESGIDLSFLMTRAISQSDWTKFVKAAGRIGEWPFMVEDASGQTVEQIRAASLRWQHTYSLDLVMVDYIGLMKAETNGYRSLQNRQEEISHISGGLKALARELDRPVIAVSQINRDVENRRGDKRPSMADLRESGSLEQDADVILFVYRDVVYNENTEFPDRMEIIVSKQRNGPPGTSVAFFNRRTAGVMDLPRNVPLIDLDSL